MENHFRITPLHRVRVISNLWEGWDVRVRQCARWSRVFVALVSRPPHWGEANIPISSQPKTKEYAENDGTGPDDDDSFPLLHLDPEAYISQRNILANIDIGKSHHFDGMQCGRLLTKCVESQSQPNLTSPWKEGCNPYLGTMLNPHLVATLGPWTIY